MKIMIHSRSIARRACERACIEKEQYYFFVKNLSHIEFARCDSHNHQQEEASKSKRRKGLCFVSVLFIQHTSNILPILTMATAGDRHEALTGNIWSYAHRGDLTGIKAALFRGVDVDLPNTVGWTALHAAAAGGHTKIIRFLLKHGARHDIADHGGGLPAHQAAKNGHGLALEALGAAGADLTLVRLSHAKGNAVREILLEALRNAGKDSNEDDTAVGYSRRQSKSTAFWGPRKTPISGKIKKHILKQRRQKKIQKQQDNTVEIGSSRLKDLEEVAVLEKIEESQNCGEIDNYLYRPETDPSDNPETNGMKYLDVVQQVKRAKKQRRKARQTQNTGDKLRTEVAHNDTNNSSEVGRHHDLLSYPSTSDDSSSNGDEIGTTKSEKLSNTAFKFNLLIIRDDSDGGE